MNEAGDYHQWVENTLILKLRIQPKSSRDEIVGVYGDRLKIRIQSAPVDNQANLHLIRFLAKIFKVKQSQVNLLAGHNSRDKRVQIVAPKQLPFSVPQKT